MNSELRQMYSSQHTRMIFGFTELSTEVPQMMSPKMKNFSCSFAVSEKNEKGVSASTTLLKVTRKIRTMDIKKTKICQLRRFAFVCRSRSYSCSYLISTRSCWAVMSLRKFKAASLCSIDWSELVREVYSKSLRDLKLLMSILSISSSVNSVIVLLMKSIWLDSSFRLLRLSLVNALS